MKHKEDNFQQEDKAEDKNNIAFESKVNTSFFCTNDRAFERIDNNEIFQYISSQYENLNQSNEDAIIKKTIIVMLNNENFISNMLDYYGITIQDIFKILYGQYSGIFKGPYLKKIRGIVESKHYV